MSWCRMNLTCGSLTLIFLRSAFKVQALCTPKPMVLFIGENRVTRRCLVSFLAIVQLSTRPVHGVQGFALPARPIRAPRFRHSSYFTQHMDVHSNLERDEAFPSRTQLPTVNLVQRDDNEDGTYEKNPNEDNNEMYKNAIRNTLLSIAVSIMFGAGLWITASPSVGEEFFAGYIVEKSLSVDNLFVFLLLFDYFQVPLAYQGRVLNWGIYGSIVMRAIMIALGAAALQNFRAILLVFAGILIYSAAQVLVDVEENQDETSKDLSSNPVISLSRYLCESNESCDIDAFGDDVDDRPAVVMFSRSLFPSTSMYDGDRFFTVEDGIKKATPLFVCMVAVELSDVVFAVDSIPAVFGVTENPLVVFSSNMFAILGLRSLYPVLALTVILSILGLGVGASMMENRRGED